MKEEELIGLDVTCYTKTLDNGLDIILLPYEDKKNYYITYVTKYGADIEEFKVDGKYQKVPHGVAHFLEHKLFETEEGDAPFGFFSRSGSGVNASTSYNFTQYLCFGTKNFKENLKFLIDFVNKPYFTNENVEKEKGIIKQEILMYDDIPEAVLETKLRENIYHKHPRRVDIAGNVEDIASITKEDLYKCYNTFYKPNNMFIVISGGFNKEEALEIIEDSLKEKTKEEFQVKEVKEPKTIVKAREEISNSNVKVPKIAMGLKLSKEDIVLEDDLEIDLYLQMISTLIFGLSSEFREEMRNRHLMSGFFYQWESVNKYKTLLIMAESEEPDLLVKEIEKALSKIVLDEASFNRMKKVWISSDVRMADYIEDIASYIMDDKLRYNRIYGNKLEIYRNMSKEKLDKVVKSIKVKNLSTIIMLPQSISKKEFAK